MGITSKEKNNRVKNKVNALTDKAKFDYYMNLLSSYRKDIKKSWQVINKLLCRKKSNQDITEVIFDGKPCTDI